MSHCVVTVPLLSPTVIKCKLSIIGADILHQGIYHIKSPWPVIVSALLIEDAAELRGTMGPPPDAHTGGRGLPAAHGDHHHPPLQPQRHARKYQGGHE